MTTRNVCIAAFALMLIALGAREAHSQQLNVGPTMNQQHEPSALRDACLNPSQWPTGWARMTYFENALQSFDNMSDGDQQACLANLRNSGKVLVIGVAALRAWCQTGVACWNEQYAELVRLYNNGPLPTTYLAIDEPWTWGPPGTSMATAINETVSFMYQARSVAPGIGFMLREAYPHHTAGDLITFYQQVNYWAQVYTGTGLQYASIDWDWYYGGSANVVAGILGSVGVGREVIYWNAHPGLSWGYGLELMALEFRNIGWQPDIMSVINWTGQPAGTVPEWDGGTFANSVRKFAETYAAVPSSSSGLPQGAVMNPGDSRTSPDGRMQLVYQYDGNLVLYGPNGFIWTTWTHGTSPGWVVNDYGELRVHDSQGEILWRSYTGGYSGAFLSVQSDGNLVMYYNPGAPVSVWATNTNFY